MTDHSATIARKRVEDQLLGKNDKNRSRPWSDVDYIVHPHEWIAVTGLVVMTVLLRCTAGMWASVRWFSSPPPEMAVIDPISGTFFAGATMPSDLSNRIQSNYCRIDIYDHICPSPWTDLARQHKDDHDGKCIAVFNDQHLFALWGVNETLAFQPSCELETIVSDIGDRFMYGSQWVHYNIASFWDISDFDWTELKKLEWLAIAYEQAIKCVDQGKTSCVHPEHNIYIDQRNECTIHRRKDCDKLEDNIAFHYVLDQPFTVNTDEISLDVLSKAPTVKVQIVFLQLMIHSWIRLINLSSSHSIGERQRLMQFYLHRIYVSIYYQHLQFSGYSWSLEKFKLRTRQALAYACDPEFQSFINRPISPCNDDVQLSAAQALDEASYKMKRSIGDKRNGLANRDFFPDPKIKECMDIFVWERLQFLTDKCSDATKELPFAAKAIRMKIDGEEWETSWRWKLYWLAFIGMSYHLCSCGEILFSDENVSQIEGRRASMKAGILIKIRNNYLTDQQARIARYMYYFLDTINTRQMAMKIRRDQLHTLRVDLACSVSFVAVWFVAAQYLVWSETSVVPYIDIALPMLILWLVTYRISFLNEEREREQTTDSLQDHSHGIGMGGRYCAGAA